jgi:integrase
MDSGHDSRPFQPPHCYRKCYRKTSLHLWGCYFGARRGHDLRLQIRRRGRQIGQSPKTNACLTVKQVHFLNVLLDVRRRRRVMSAEQFKKLRKATAKRKSRRRSTPELRVWIYRLARETGFRAAELASLTPGHFDFSGAVAVAIQEAAISKRGLPDRQPLAPAFVTELSAWLAGKHRDQKLFPERWYRKAAEMLVEGLQAAKIGLTNDRRDTFDFYSLRHTFVSAFSRVGVHPKTTQTLARHGHMSQTMNTYTHVEELDLLEAVGKASPSSPPSSPRGCSKRRSGALDGTEDWEAGEGI